MLRRTHERLLAEQRREHAAERRAWNEERERLLDRIMLLADKPLLPEPSSEPQVLVLAASDEYDPDGHPDLFD